MVDPAIQSASSQHLPISWLIRDAGEEDLPVLTRFVRRLAWETERRRLVGGSVRRGIRGILRDSRTFGLLAETADGQPAGLLLVGGSEISDFSGGPRWIVTSIFVPRAHRKRGILRALYAELRARANARGIIGIRLHVHRRNRRATRAYERLGLARLPYHVMGEDLDA